MKMTKKLLALLMTLAMVFALTSCAGDVGSAMETAADVIDAVDQVAQALDYEDQPQTTDESALADDDWQYEIQTQPVEDIEVVTMDENGWYYSRDEVAYYIHTFGHLPGNYITKAQARELGWEGGSVEQYMEGGAIGGDRFGNYEGLLPEGKSYTECDIDTLGQSSRGAKRIIFSDDGCVYYTDDHYESFQLLYGEE